MAQTPPPDRPTSSDAARSGLPRGRPVDSKEVHQLYQELRQIARRERRVIPSATLNTTALVHEVWMRLSSSHDHAFNDRRHFLGTAAVAMRRLVVDYARHRTSQKRGGGIVHVELGDPEAAESATLAQILDIDRALADLESVDPGLRRLVELRFFGGLTGEEAAEVLEVSPRTVAREWIKARALMKLALAPPED